MGLRSFVSEESLALHREHLAVLRAKKQMCIENREAKSLALDIRAHELYFSSFCKERVLCPRIKEGYHSENRFCFALTEYAREIQCGYLFIYPIPRFPFVSFGSDGALLHRAALAVDLWEHAYFLDYGFDRDAYLKAALSHLDFSKLMQF